MNSKHLSKTFLVGAVSFALSVSQVRGEGAKDTDSRWARAFGANRVVRTVTGYTDVKGYFRVPEFHLPIIYLHNPGGSRIGKPTISQSIYSAIRGTGSYNPDSLDGYMKELRKANAQNSLLNANSNPNDDKPTFYLGSEYDTAGPGAVEVDAGLQYEWMPLYGAPPGWSLFISHDGDYYSPHVMVNGKERAYRAGLDTNNSDVQEYRLVHGVESDGRIYLHSDARGGNNIADPIVKFHWHLGQNQVAFSADQLAFINVKRVQGITQKTGVSGVLDNSFMRGCLFQQGYVRTTDEVDFAPWMPIDVNDARTGYKPDGTDLTGGPAIFGNLNCPQFKIDYPSVTENSHLPLTDVLHIRGAWHNVKGSEQTDVYRYKYEQVDINLRSGSHVVGYTIRPRSGIALNP